MAIRLNCLVATLCLAVVLGTPRGADAQADPQNFQFNSGQTLQPFFEGWTHNPDGSFEMHFGYFNRNYVEELHVPLGPNNRMSPDGPDRGQPTYFYPHSNHNVFSATVPADWGDKRLVWQTTIRNETFQALGWLQPEWEIAPGSSSFGAASEGQDANQPPTLALEFARTVAVSDTLKMTATVSDDGLPEPFQFGGGGQGTLPTFEEQPDGPTLPINLPQLQGGARKSPTRTRVEGVTVTWAQQRGPTGVKLEAVDDDTPEGVAVVAATFTTPGDYRFRVQASDGFRGGETVTQFIEVTVR